MRADGAAGWHTPAAGTSGFNAFVSFADADGGADGAPDGPLVGMPCAIKDNIAVAGQPLRCGSALLGAHVAPFSATCVRRLQCAGAIVAGKTNLDEFGMGSDTQASVHGGCANPWDTELVPGGSSGGSAAAVAAGIVPFALGSDTGGSVPAAGILLRRVRAQAHLRRGFAVRAGLVRLVTGGDRHHRRDACAVRGGAGGDRRPGRARPVDGRRLAGPRRGQDHRRAARVPGGAARPAGAHGARRHRRTARRVGVPRRGCRPRPRCATRPPPTT